MEFQTRAFDKVGVVRGVAGRLFAKRPSVDGNIVAPVRI